MALYIVYCFKGAPCKPWDLSALGDAAADSWTVTYVMAKRAGTWILLDDSTYGLGIGDDPPWVPNGPQYEPDPPA